MAEASRFRGIGLSMIRAIMADAPKDAINLALGELGYPLPATLRQKAIQIMANATPRYTPNAGLVELREAVAKYCGSDTTAEQVCVCNGAEEAVFLSLFSILEPGDRVAIPDPDYTAYPAITKLLGCEVVRLPHAPDLCSLDQELWESLLSQNIKALIISDPRNPSGVFLDESQKNWLADLCARYKVALIADEIYGTLSFAARVPSFAGREGNIFLINGLSKSHCMSGWRLGWVVAPKQLSSTLVKAKQYVSTCTNWLSQILALHALSGEGKHAAAEVYAQLCESRDFTIRYLENNLDSACLHIPTASPYIMLKCASDSLSVARKLATRGVICVPGAAFGDVSASWLRINYAVETDALALALPEIVNELHI